MKRIMYIFLIVLGIFAFACNSGLKTEKLAGKWKVSDMKVDIPNVPPQLIINAKTLALSTQYEFKSDMTFCMTISNNELESGRRQTGTITLNSNKISLITDSLMFEKNGIWTLVEKNDFSKPYFETMKMTIEKKSDNQLFLTEKENNGFIYYTLDRIE